MSSLSGPRRDAQSGTPTSLVILLHGYGADGNDLIGLADALAPHLPDTVFLAPNAPERSALNPMGYQWFPIPWIDGSSEAQMTEGFLKAREVLDTYLTEAMAAEGMSPAETVVVGFSQGTMMALATLPRRDQPVAGIVGFSGRLHDAETLARETKVRPPVLLIHGDRDEMIPVVELARAEQGLRQAGFQVTSHVSRGTGHGIAPDGLGLALEFLNDRLRDSGG